MQKTTDPQDELFYRVDEADKVLGSIKRGEAHHDASIIHRAAHLIIENNEGKILLQKRTMTKDKYPGAWIDAVAGHVNYGSNYLDTIIREALEEIGLDVKKENIKEVGKLLFKAEAESEYVKCYKLVADINIQELHLNADEVTKVQFFSLDEIRNLMQDPKVELVPITRSLLENFIV